MNQNDELTPSSLGPTQCEIGVRSQVRVYSSHGHAVIRVKGVQELLKLRSKAGLR